MNTTTDSLAQAIDYLDAVEVAPGRYAYRDDATRRYYVVDADDLRGLYDYDDDGHLLPIDAPRSTHAQYSVWCADSQATEMPSWWTPEQRFAWRSDWWGDSVVTGNDAPNDGSAERITADLETGGEIPA